MQIPDYMEQAVLPGFGRDRTGSAMRFGSLAARSSVNSLIWAGLDFVSAFVAGLIAFRIRLTADGVPVTPGHFGEIWTSIPMISVCYLVLFGVYLVAFGRLYGLYKTAPGRNSLNEQRMTIQAVLTAGLVLCGTLYVMRAYAVSRIVVALTLVLTMFAVMLRRAIWARIQRRRFVQGREVRNVLIVGDGRVGNALRNHLLSLQSMGFRFMGFVSIDESAPQREGAESSPVVGTLKNCVTVARSLFVDEIYFTVPVERDKVIALVDEAHANGIDVRVVPDLYDGLAWNAPVEYVGQFPTIPLHRRDFPRGAFVLKRVLDIVACSVALVLCAPLMLLIALMVKVDSKGPVFFRAERVGRKGRNFTCLKFRTMVNEADRLRNGLADRNEREGLLFKISKDPRVTPVGHWLRKYSLDELPQFFNVLAGDMSLVGPRPPLTSEVQQYDLPHLRRLDVLPGITGLWQVEARQDPSFDNYISLDTAYVENWSLLLDLKIMARTVGVVVSGTGV
jgi:exopolysaccharide biosynthesis polyprenyl glycosylphosphotransferase